MAFRPLTEAECGQENPLSKLTSHVLHDHTFSESHGQVFPNSSDQLVEQFLQETRQIPQTFRMDDLMREMHEIESQRSLLPPVPASTVKDQLHDGAWAQQYIEDGKTFHDNSHSTIWNEIINEENQLEPLSQIWQKQAGVAENMLNSATSGSEFEDVSAPQQRPLGPNESPFVYSKFMRFMTNLDDGPVHFEDGKLTKQEAAAWSDEYLTAGARENTEALAEGWAEEHLKTNDEEVDSNFWEHLQEGLKRVSAEDADDTWLNEFNNYYNVPNLEYVFTDENPMFDVANPLQRGKQYLEENDFPSAVLCFEAAVKKDPQSIEAWLLLGKTQAENEQDPKAIQALNKCLELDKDNLQALMALSVSYTNESYYNQACIMLLNWLRSNPKYSSLVPADLTLKGDHHRIVQDLFIKAAQMNPQDVDHEVQSGLGVLFNVSHEFEKAADCFKAALSVKPDDARLWNRLGASLANGSRPEEAVDAYHHALNLQPGFIRARYNVGITCIHLRAYKEAAEHFLLALNQQAKGKYVGNLETTSQMSDAIWRSLRMAIGFLNLNEELDEALEKRDLSILNKKFNIDE